MAEGFAPRFVDLVRNTTLTEGTGNLVLGSPVSGFTSFATAVQPGDSFYYSVAGIEKPAEREVGRGTMQADGTIRREAIGGELTDFTAGTKTVALVAPAEWFNQVQAALQDGPPGDGSVTAANRAELAAIPAPAAGSGCILLENGRAGLFVFSSEDYSAETAADSLQGIHVAPGTDPSGASGAWVRRFDGPVSPLWFGIVEGNAGGANGPANSSALAAMFSTLRVRASNPIAGFQGIEPIRFPTGYFEFGSTIDLTEGTFTIEGAGSGMSGGIATWLKFPAGVTGIRVQRQGTEGATATRAAGRGGDGSIIRNIRLEGGYATSGTDGEHHGIHLRARAHVEHVRLGNFEGDGIFCDGNSLNGNNCNNFGIEAVTAHVCRDGVRVTGGDGNAGWVIGAECSSNRRWGVNDTSFLGNTYVGCHTAANGFGAYRTTDNNARNVLVGCYSEGDQPPSSFVGPTLVLGGLHAAGTGAYTGFVDAGPTGALTLNGIFNATAPISSNVQLMLEGSAGGAQTIRAAGLNSSLVLEQTGDVLGTSRLSLLARTGFLGALFETTHPEAHLVDFLFRTAAPGDHSIRYERRQGYLAGGNSVYQFELGTAGSPDVYIGDAGINLAAGNTLKVNGTQVVGAQQGAIANHASDAIVNAILAALRNHGLIAA